MVQAALIGTFFGAMILVNAVFVWLALADRIKPSQIIGIRIPAAFKSAEAWYVVQRAVAPFRMLAAVFYLAGLVVLVSDSGAARFGLLIAAVAIDIALFVVGHVVANRKAGSVQ